MRHGGGQVVLDDKEYSPNARPAHDRKLPSPFAREGELIASPLPRFNEVMVPRVLSPRAVPGPDPGVALFCSGGGVGAGVAIAMWGNRLGNKAPRAEDTAPTDCAGRGPTARQFRV